jgi:hypothetical protein
MSAHARQTNAASDLSRRRGFTCRGQLVFAGTNRGSHGAAAMGRPGGARGERPAPSPQEPTDPSQLGGPVGLAGLLNPTGPRVGTAGFTHIEERFQDPGGPCLALLAGNSSILVLHDQDRRLVGFVVSLANHAQRPVPEVNRVSRLPMGTAALSVGGSAGSPSGVSSLNRNPAIAEITSGGPSDHSARRESRSTSASSANAATAAASGRPDQP